MKLDKYARYAFITRFFSTCNHPDSYSFSVLLFAKLMSHSRTAVFPDADAAVIIPHVAVLADATANADLRPSATHSFPLIHIFTCFLARPIPRTLTVLLVLLAFQGRKHIKILIVLIIYI